MKPFLGLFVVLCLLAGLGCGSNDRPAPSPSQWQTPPKPGETRRPVRPGQAGLDISRKDARKAPPTNRRQPVQ